MFTAGSEEVGARRHGQASASSRHAGRLGQQLHQADCPGARRRVGAEQALLPDDRVDQFLGQPGAPAGAAHVGVEGPGIQHVVIVEQLLACRGRDGLVVPAPAGRETHGLHLPRGRQFVVRRAPLGGRFGVHLAAQQFARADEGGVGRQRVDLGVVERERLESRREFPVQPRRRVRGVPVVGRDDRGIQLACLRLESPSCSLARADQ